ncbi:MAG: hypothetical protein ABSC63_19280 [Candidatus Binataceae bacterium]
MLALRQCGGRKRDKLVRRARSLRADGMLTTTISDRASGGVDARSLDGVAFLQERERIFRRHVQRVLGGFAYLWVIEVGEEGGRVHRHYLVRWRRRAMVSGFRRGWLPPWVLVKLQDFAKSAHLGRIDWRPIENEESAGRYVTKYVSKTIAELGEGLPVRFRRFGSNEHYEEPKEPGWWSVAFPLDVVLRLLDAPPLRATAFDYWLLPESYLEPCRPSRPPPSVEQVLNLPLSAW